MVRMTKLFAYDDLQTEEVQLAIFGRKLIGQEDVLPGYKLVRVVVRHPDIIEQLGKNIQLLVTYTGLRRNLIKGTIFKVTWPELLAADQYEMKEYKRVSAVLLSGKMAWFYITKYT